LLSLRSPHSMPVVQSIMRWFHALALGRRELAKSETLFRHYFAIRIRAPESSDGRSVFPVTTQRQATALLIGAPDLLAGLGQAVVDALMEENRILNQKAESETLLINSQGVLYATPGGSYKSPHPNRFGKLSDLTTLAVYAREYLGDEVGFSSRWPIFSGLVGAEIGRMIDSQSVTFGSSFSNHQTWARLAGSLHLTAHLDDWRRSRQSLHSVNSGVLQIDRLPGRWWETEDIGSILESRRSGASDPLASVLPS